MSVMSFPWGTLPSQVGYRNKQVSPCDAFALRPHGPACAWARDVLLKVLKVESDDTCIASKLGSWR